MSVSRDPRELFDQACAGSRLAVGRLLSHIERGGANADIVSDLIQAASNSATSDGPGAHVVGITGAPGAGKSTLVGQLIGLLVADGSRPAVLAVDPSSPLTGGAIMGDRIRMDDLASGTAWEPGQSQAAFIRSMATRGHSGGLALAVPLAVRLFEAVGFDPIVIETVGVGQVEVDVVGAADTAVVVATPGMGDAVQANKAGLLEVADVFVVNKADRPGANNVRRDLEIMLDLGHLSGHDMLSGHRPPIVMASAVDGTGANDVLDALRDHRTHLDTSGQRLVRRQNRMRAEVEARMTQAVLDQVDAALVSVDGRRLIDKAEAGSISPGAVSRQLLEGLGRDLD